MNGIRRVVELRENVMMDENKTRMKCLSAGRKCDRNKREKETFQVSLFHTEIRLFFQRRHHHQSRRALRLINR